MLKIHAGDNEIKNHCNENLIFSQQNFICLI